MFKTFCYELSHCDRQLYRCQWPSTGCHTGVFSQNATVAHATDGRTDRQLFAMLSTAWESTETHHSTIRHQIRHIATINGVDVAAEQQQPQQMH